MSTENNSNSSRWLKALKNNTSKNTQSGQINSPAKNIDPDSDTQPKHRILFGLETPLHHDDFGKTAEYYRVNGSHVIEKNRADVPCTYSPHDWDQHAFMTDISYRLPWYKSCLVDFEQISKIPSDKTYVYPIFINDVNYFRKCNNIGFDNIHPRVHQDVLRHKAIIVIMFQNEGTSGEGNNTDLDILSEWTEKAGFPRSGVIYIHGNLLMSQSSENYGFIPEPCSSFEYWIPKPLPVAPVQHNLSDADNLFLCLNRRPRESRTYTMLKLYDHRLFHRGKISYNIPRDQLASIKKQNSSVPYRSEKYFRKNPEKTLDLAGFDHNPARDINLELHANTFLHLNTETLVGDGTLFMSEKIFKPIVVGQPFLLIGNKGSLEKLHQWGYKTFNKWWDESYDLDGDWKTRIDKTVSILTQLSKKSVQELTAIREEMLPVLQHNQEIFLKRLNRRYTGTSKQARFTPIYDIIEKHVLRLYNKQNRGQVYFRDKVSHSDLHEKALWVIVDPWEKMDREMVNPHLVESINVYMSHKILSYLRRNKVKNTVVLSYLTPSSLFTKQYEWLKSHESLTSYCEQNGFDKIVFCGFHNQICIKNIGTEHQQDKSVYLMSDLCAVLPRNWLDISEPSDLAFDFSYNAYGDHVIVI